MISTSNLGIQFGSKPLFENVSVKFGKSHRYGLIGANGSGKSTFVKILAGEIEPSHGTFSFEPNARVGKLKQDQFAYEDQSAMDVVLQGHVEMWNAMKERDAIYENPNSTDEDFIKAAELENIFAQFDGYTAQSRAAELLCEIGLDQSEHYTLMANLDAGLKLRILLAQAIFSNPDVLLLDEPTNNLDINTIRWLENTLDRLDSTMIIISHDRHFLNRICTHIADLDYNTINIYTGNYDDYMLASTQAKQRAMASNAKAKERIQELQDFISRFSANKSKARQATSRLKQVDKIKSQMVEIKPSSRQNPYIRFEFDEKSKLHRQALIVQSLSKAFQNKLFSNLNLQLDAGEKIAIVGPNGSGKSTFLKILARCFDPSLENEDYQADSGSVKWAEKAIVGYFPQDHEEEFQEDKSLVDYLTQYKQASDDEQTVIQTLGRLLFGSEYSKKRLNHLSGGEQGRMLYGRLILQRPNILLMDEPTNHMDIETIESLNMALDKYKGTLIFVSHDRQFVNTLATQIIELDGKGNFTHFVGNYDDYLISRDLA